MPKPIKIVVVLGAGRTGTSILMQVLRALGMGVSEVMVAANEQNPLGFYEDAEIFQLQTSFLSQISSSSMPLPDGWIDSEPAIVLRNQLKDILESRVQNNTKMFGFKDPRTALLLPLWKWVFKELGFLPLYILATREPESVVNSMKMRYNTNELVAELFWLTKNTEAIYHTEGNCFVVHHEDWFTDRAPDVVTQLLDYTGLVETWDKTKNPSDIISDIVKFSLNRASSSEHLVQNNYVRMLHAQLQKCRGNRFDIQLLLQEVNECREAMVEFSGWAIEAQTNFVCARGSIKNINKLNELVQKHIEISDENERYERKVSNQTKELDAKDQKLFAVQSSPTFQVGKAMVKAITRPGKNTLLLPFNIMRVLLASRSLKKTGSTTK